MSYIIYDNYGRIMAIHVKKRYDARQYVAGAWGLGLGAWGLALVAYIFYNLNQGRHHNILASILNQKTSHSCARKREINPAYRV
jgi:hypothetical protein